MEVTRSVYFLEKPDLEEMLKDWEEVDDHRFRLASVEFSYKESPGIRDGAMRREYVASGKLRAPNHTTADYILKDWIKNYKMGYQTKNSFKCSDWP